MKIRIYLRHPSQLGSVNWTIDVPDYLDEEEITEEVQEKMWNTLSWDWDYDD